MTDARERRAQRGVLASGPEQPHWAVLCGSEPPEGGFRSDQVQIIHNWADTPWRDEAPHRHASSDEIYVVLEGEMHLDVEGVRESIGAGEFLCVPAGITHQLVDVVVPHRSLVIRGPSVRDKIVATTEAAPP